MTAKRKVAVCTSWTFQDPIVRGGLTKAHGRQSPSYTRLKPMRAKEEKRYASPVLSRHYAPARGRLRRHNACLAQRLWATAARNRGACRRRKTNLARHGHAWQDSRGGSPLAVDRRHPDQSGGAARCKRPLGTGYRDGACNGGGSGHAHKPREGADASGASDRTRHPCQRPTDWGTGHAHCPPITVRRLSTNSKMAKRWFTPVRNEAIVLDRCKSFNINTWLSHVGGPILPLRGLIAHRNDACRVQLIHSVPVERMLWPG